MWDKRLVVALCASMAGVWGCATMDSPAPVRYSGGVLVNSAGMTLYTFDKDPAGAGKSVCTAGCAKIWPPLAAAAGDEGGGDFTIISRDDGTRQWAYQGKPLYQWSKDAKPGDRTGDGFRGIWHVIHQETSSGGRGSMGSGY